MSDLHPRIVKLSADADSGRATLEECVRAGSSIRWEWKLYRLEPGRRFAPPGRQIGSRRWWDGSHDG